MYNTVKIEKGFYNLSGKTFSQALEAVDKTCALEMIRGGEVTVDVDKLISKLSDGAAVAVNVGFSVISADAVKCLAIGA